MAEARSRGLPPLRAAAERRAPARGDALVARPPLLQHLAVALDVRAGRQQLHAVRAGLELAHRRRRDADDVASAQLEDLVVDLHAAGAGEDDVHLLGLPVTVTESGPLAGVHPVVADADALGADVLADVARLAELPHAELRGEVLGVVDVRLRVSRAHRPQSKDGSPPRLGRIRHVVTRPTTSTRGILRPEAIGRVFSLRRTPPAA